MEIFILYGLILLYFLFLVIFVLIVLAPHPDTQSSSMTTWESASASERTIAYIALAVFVTLLFVVMLMHEKE